MRKTAVIAAGALLGTIGLAGTAQAGHDVNPSARVAEYDYGLDAVQDTAVVPNTSATGETTVKALPNGRIEVTVVAEGLAPNLPHAMHLHGVLGEPKDEACPAPDSSGVVTTADGQPSYGGVVASLTTSGDASAGSALALDRFPVADENGRLEYQRAIPVDETVHAEAGTLQVVVHGADFDGNGTYAINEDDRFASQESSIAEGAPLEATVPVLCGGVAN